ncbi:hypothetical protein D7Y11_32725 [Corallococcus sp. AB018]|nr:hypothetical protein D7Y11_32725 [Corallococcus sp. AB018]
MRDLGIRVSDDEDCLRLSFEGSFDCNAEIERSLGPFVDILEQYAGDWMPQVVGGGGKHKRRYSRAALWKVYEESRFSKWASIGFYRTEPPAVELNLSLNFPPLEPSMRLSLSLQPLSGFSDAGRCGRFVDMVRAWAEAYQATSVLAHSMMDHQLAEPISFGEDGVLRPKYADDNIHEVYWLNVFGKKQIELVGRERLLSVPGSCVEELPNGSVLLVTHPTAADFGSDEARVAQARALVHLRPDLEFEAVMGTLRERTSSLVPVEPRFHPDVEPLLKHQIEHVPLSERPRKTAEFNAYRPPDPEEWLPATAALSANVREKDAVPSQYVELTRGLDEFLFYSVQSIYRATPSSLTEIDVALLSHVSLRLGGAKAVAHMVPAVGVYLGQVLVKNLGGEWILRKQLEESQVRIGGRVWLPFVRAQRYLTSQQAVIDYSLTQFYREAERRRS